MNTTAELQDNTCIVTGVQPLLTELRESVTSHFRGQNDEGRDALEGFIHDIFQAAYGARLQTFYPNLAAFSTDGRLRAVVGYRDGMVKPLFSEQYLDKPIEELMSAHLGQSVDRRLLVEVGNLALASPGEARWVIAAITVFLHAAGYRWVLFTAVKSLFNAFRRLGLNPIQVARSDPGRLPDGGSSWGRYYQAGPVVCAGDIEAGYRKLSAHVSRNQPKLHALLLEARWLGSHTRYGRAQAIEEAL